MDYRENEFLWVEKYRPRKLEDCILPADQKRIFHEMLAKGEIQNMLLCGGAGMGKTTVARALCEELETDYIIINGSEESGIDVLRTKIKQFASTVSFSGKPKVVILDEADYLNPNSTQPALRAFIEEFSANCRFILTCNFKNRIIPPLHSRTAVIEFKLPKADKPCHVETKQTIISKVAGIPIAETQFVKVINLPEPEEGVYYIVSRICMDFIPFSREDVFCVDTGPSAIRDESGQVVAVTQLSF